MMHACTVRIMGANQTCYAWRHLLVKLALKVIGLTVVLQVSSMAFADEMVLSMLILLTIALTSAALVTWRADEQAASSATQPSTTASDREIVVSVSGE